jgi:hypothetical protein
VVRHRGPRFFDIAEYITGRDIVCDMPEPAKHLTRLPRDLYETIQQEADKQGTSANGLIVAILAAAMNYRAPKTDETMPVVSIWGSQSHVEEIAERLGLFETWHLEHELQMTKSPVRKRVNQLLREGRIVEDRPSSGAVTAIYRWVGPMAEK